MRLALFGGTFDPIHRGHLEATLAAANSFSLDRVLVVPSGVPPHKTTGCRATFEDRFRMVELACAADRRLTPSRLEDPQGRKGPHYSITTIERIGECYRFQPPLHLIIGADAFAEVNAWRAVDRILASVEFLVIGRPGLGPSRPAVPGRARVRFIECANPVSASLVRHRVKIGGSLADLAPPAVCTYIREKGLYRT